MRWLAVAIAVTLSMSVLPITPIVQGSEHHWNGYVLDRETISNHVLIDENYDYYSLKKGTHDVIVVAFIFTTCPDVCPVITSNLVTAEKQLDGIDYQFISITVDPAKDTPAVLREYMQNYGASWPHLTAELEDMQAVWDDFMIQVNTTELENHDHEHGTGYSEEETHSDQDEEPSVMVALPSGNIYSNNVELNGFDQLTASAYKNGWTVNSSSSQWGTFVSGLNQDDGPADYSWWWELHSWNTTSEAWEASMVGIDSIEAGNLAFAPNSTDDTAIPAPQGDDASFTIVQSNGSTDTAVMEELNAWHMSIGALDSFVAPDSDWGHYMTTIDGVEAPADYSWWWALNYWDEANESWMVSNVGMDSLVDKQHILWAPNSTDISSIPAPDDYMVHKLGVVYADGSSELFDAQYYNMAEVSAIEHTNVALSQNDINYSETNSTVTSIGGSDSNYSLYIWQDMGSFSHWMSVSDSADDAMLMKDANHFAWVAEGQDASDLSSPEVGHDGVKNETSTSHSTQTFILDSNWKPKVVFVGYDWNVDHFVEDVKRAAGQNPHPDDNDDWLPGFTFVTLTAGIGLAIIASSRDE
ncbi:MAG: SCO family protein [Candidatus Thermoplasmatota archaeon]|nr:SCO family protein [Candidatus Thermoplasmatota archaeon]